MVRTVEITLIALVGLSISIPSIAEVDESSRDLRGELEKLRSDYESRIDALEKRVEDAETTSAEAQTRATEASEKAEAIEAESGGIILRTGRMLERADSYFNPQISVILQGLFSEYFGDDDGDFLVPGVLSGSDAGPPAEGFSLGESEVVFSANVDDKIYGFFNLAFEVEDGSSDLDIEEAYAETFSLPMGFNARAGQFFSAIGYHNAIHSHAWDFVDAPLVYESFLGTAYIDPGARLSWIAPTDLYLEIGGEYFRGDDFPGGGAAHDGKGTGAVFAVSGGDIGESNSWQFGLSYLATDPRNRKSDVGGGSQFSFTGDSDVLLADLVWKWAPFGNFKNRYFIFQSEYMWRHEDGSLVFDNTLNTFTGKYDGDQQGFYAQGIYQFHPRWRFGLRYDQLFSDNDVKGVPSTILDQDGKEPRRISTMIDFSNSEFSRFRVQYSYQQDGLEQDHMLFFQYIVSLGSHGAHAY